MDFSTTKSGSNRNDESPKENVVKSFDDDDCLVCQFFSPMVLISWSLYNGLVPIDRNFVFQKIMTPVSMRNIAPKPSDIRLFRMANVYCKYYFIEPCDIHSFINFIVLC